MHIDPEVIPPCTDHQTRKRKRSYSTVGTHGTISHKITMAPLGEVRPRRRCVEVGAFFDDDNARRCRFGKAEEWAFLVRMYVRTMVVGTVKNDDSAQNARNAMWEDERGPIEGERSPREGGRTRRRATGAVARSRRAQAPGPARGVGRL